MLNIERVNNNMKTFLEKKNKEKAIIIMNFCLHKFRLGRLHKWLSRMMIAYRSEVTKAKPDPTSTPNANGARFEAWRCQRKGSTSKI